MISFKMKILNYNAGGSYSVEYIPQDTKCTPVKLDIRIDSATASNPAQVVELLKSSSPQEFWFSEINNSRVNQDALRNLVNTEYTVTNQSRETLNNPVTGFSTPHGLRPRIKVTTPNATTTLPQATPEQVASRDDQAIIKLKVIIQQVIQEMAEGTV
jgi:hypothetical protein